MNITDHISESLETIFRVKILKFFDADTDSDPGIFLTLDPGSGMEKIRRDPATLENSKHIKVIKLRVPYGQA